MVIFSVTIFNQITYNIIILFFRRKITGIIFTTVDASIFHADHFRIVFCSIFTNEFFTTFKHFQTIEIRIPTFRIYIDRF